MSKSSSNSIPLGWTVTELGSVIEPRSGKAAPASMPSARYIGMEHVEPHTMRLLGTVSASAMKSSANVFCCHDVLYGRLRSYLNKVYQPDFGGLCSGEFIVMPESPAMSGRFLKYRLNAGDFVAFASHINTGDRPRVDFDQIRSFRLLLPPKAEQQRIADVLDELLPDLDAGVKSLHQAQRKLTLYRASVLKAAVQGDLTAEWRKDHSDAEPDSTQLQRILMERRICWEQEQLRKFAAAGKTPPSNWKAKYKEPNALNTTNLPALPIGWSWVSFGQIAWSLRSGSAETSGRTPNEYPILKSSAVRPGCIDFEELNFLSAEQSTNSENFVERGDLLITRLSGSLEYVANCAVVESLPIIPTQYPDRLFRAKIIGVANAQYVAFCFQHRPLRVRLEEAAKSTAGHQRISLSDLVNFVFPMPPAAEQAEIVSLLDESFSSVDHGISNVRQRIQTAAAIRQSILRHAFTGQLVPQNSGDEPAGKLITHISEERETHVKARKSHGKHVTKQPRREK